MKEEDRSSILSRINTTTSKDLADADLVIEAVFEDMGVKKETFKKLDCPLVQTLFSLQIHLSFQS
jgi:3-hydroxyacyl-CoA dehydrogenase